MIVRLRGVAWWWLSLWLCVVHVHVSVHVHARSTVSITSPEDLRIQFPDPIDHRPAVFADAPYGSFVSGVLWYPQNPASQIGCNPFSKEADWPSATFPRADPPVIVMLNRTAPSSTPDQRCAFVSKVRYAQAIGAIAVVIINYDDVNMPYMADDGTGSNVHSPAVLIKHSVGEQLIRAMRNSSFTRITMQIGYQLPSVSGAVSWQLWTAAYDSKSWSLKSMFGPADALLHMDTSFTPKYYFIRGESMAEQCDVGTTSKPVCVASCVKQGQYCVKDPDNDGWLTGADVARENVWQMCLWKQLYSTAETNPYDMQRHLTKNKWWSYVSVADSACDPLPGTVPLPEDTCRRDILDSLNLTSSYGPISDCYTACLGGDAADECRDIEATLDERDDRGIFYLPTLVINDEGIRGSLSCKGPLETRSCQVLADICQGYNSTFRPNVSVCVAPATGCDFGLPKDCAGQCQPKSGSGVYMNGVDACGLCLAFGDKSWNKTCTDCSGLVNGPYTLDQCGLCALPNDPKRDKQCLDCHGVTWGNATKDCAGECGGAAKFDECGACVRVDQISSWNKSCTDCLGVFRGPAKLDICGVCNGDGKSCESTTTVSSSTNWGAVIAIVLAVAGVVGGVIYLYMKRQQNRMREDIDGILKQYLPLQDNAHGNPGGGGGSGHIRPTQRLSGNDNL